MKINHQEGRELYRYKQNNENFKDMNICTVNLALNDSASKGKEKNEAIYLIAKSQSKNITHLKIKFSSRGRS